MEKQAPGVPPHEFVYLPARLVHHVDAVVINLPNGLNEPVQKVCRQKEDDGSRQEDRPKSVMLA
jgi:hypothetical protein